MKPTSSAPTVEIRRWAAVSAMLSTTSPAAEKIIRRAVPRRGRDYQPATGSWVVFGSHLSRLVGALTAAGVEVVEVVEAGGAR